MKLLSELGSCFLGRSFFIAFYLSLSLSVSQAHAVSCSFTQVPYPWDTDPRYYGSVAAASEACSQFAAANGQSCNGPFDCSNSNVGDCSWRAGYIEFWVDNVEHTYDQDQFLYCAGVQDTDGDGLPDDQDPCPTDADCDDDGKPDNEDPCPQNAREDCEEPPGGLPPTVQVGDCEIDLTEFSKWLLSGSSFPFNIANRVVDILTPLFAADGSAPVIETTIEWPSMMGKQILPPTPIKIDLSVFDNIAFIIRNLIALGIAWLFAKWGINKFFLFTGVGSGD